MADQEVDERLRHPCFPQPKDTSLKVWRYLDVSKLVWMVENRKLWLSRLDTLLDTHEGSITANMGLARDAMFERAGYGDHKATDVQINHNKRLATYVSCWHMGNYESEAMWRLYCPDGKGIAIQTSYQRLYESVWHDREIYAGYIKYIDYDTEWFPTDNLYYSLMHKRRGFSHESEVRLVRVLFEYLAVPRIKDSPLGIEINWNYDSVIEHIYVNPYAPEYYVNVIKSILGKFDSALSEKVRWSQMRSQPVL